MLDILSEYLDVATTPEEKNHIAIADRFLTRAQDDNYEHVIEEILLTDQDGDAGCTVPNILAVYRQQLHYFFSLHGIEVKEDLSLKVLADIANGVLDLDNYESPQALFDLADPEASVLEQVCVMLTQTTQYTADELLHLIDDVADGFVGRLKEALLTHEPEEEDEAVNVRDRIHAYRKYLVYLQAANGSVPHIDAIIRTAGGPGMPYSFYAKMIDGQQALETLLPKQVAWELFAAALVSSDGYSHPSETVKNSLEQFISDPRTISNVMVEVRQVLMGYQP